MKTYKLNVMSWRRFDIDKDQVLDDVELTTTETRDEPTYFNENHVVAISKCYIFTPETGNDPYFGYRLILSNNTEVIGINIEEC